MKTTNTIFLLVAILLSNLTAQASVSRNINDQLYVYNITLADSVIKADCFEKIKKNTKYPEYPEQVKLLSEVGILTGFISNKNAKLNLMKIKDSNSRLCVLDVEIETEMSTRPRIGRSN